jgi:hypothetical protein
MGNVNDRARNLNEMTAAAAREGVDYGPASQRLGGLLADAYNPMGITVFHGSPAKFNKFDASKIGTGEGAQAYGYGHYVAESPEVAKHYAANVSGNTGARTFAPPSNAIQNSIDYFQAMLQNKVPRDVKSGTAVSDDYIRSQISQLNDQLPSVYTIDLPDEQIAKMLDFDKPLKEQAKEIQSLAKQYGLTDADHMGGDLIAAMDAKRPAGADAMRQAGIPGIRYLDQSSRATPNITNQRLANLYAKHGGNAEAAVDEMMRSVYNTPKKKQEMRDAFLQQLATPKTSNFVVFPGNENLLNIKKRNEDPLGLFD